jgi:hypothetical protein
MVPPQNIVKESAKIASVAIAAPATPIAAPVQNPPPTDPRQQQGGRNRCRHSSGHL